MLWAMQHMDLEGAAKAEEKADAKSNAAEGHFPVPTGRPGRPPALVRPPMRSTGGPTPTTGNRKVFVAPCWSRTFLFHFTLSCFQQQEAVSEVQRCVPSTAATRRP